MPWEESPTTTSNGTRARYPRRSGRAPTATASSARPSTHTRTSTRSADGVLAVDPTEGSEPTAGYTRLAMTSDAGFPRRDEPWIFRTYAGYATPELTNARFK